MAESDEKKESKFKQVNPNDGKEQEKTGNSKVEKPKKEKLEKQKPIKEKGKKRNILARTVAVIIVLALVIGIIYISIPSPARALEDMFRNLKSGKIEVAAKYVDYEALTDIPALGMPSNTENEGIINEQSTEEVEAEDKKEKDNEIKYSEEEKVLFSDLEWNIKKIEKTNEEAKIEVEITNKNYKTIFQNFMKKVFQKILNNENPSDEEIEQYLLEEVKSEDIDKATSTQIITVQKQDGKWKVVVDDNLKNAIFPNLNEAINQVSNID